MSGSISRLVAGGTGLGIDNDPMVGSGGAVTVTNGARPGTIWMDGIYGLNTPPGSAAMGVVVWVTGAAGT